MTFGILTDREIYRAVEDGSIEIEPFDRAQLNPVSYDLTLGDGVKVYSYTGELDAKKEPACVDISIRPSGLLLCPGIGYLMHTRERVFTKSFVPVLDGKSSIGRLFISVHATAGYGDPGFNGQYTLEVTVTHPIRVYVGMRIAQMRFHTMAGVIEKLYDGNYVGESARGAVASRAWRQFKEKP